MHFQLLSEITLNKSPPDLHRAPQSIASKVTSALSQEKISVTKKSLSQEKIKKTLYIKSQHHLYICLNLVVNNSVENNVRIRKEQRWNTCGFTSLTKVLDGSVGEKKQGKNCTILFIFKWDFYFNHLKGKKETKSGSVWVFHKLFKIMQMWIHKLTFRTPIPFYLFHSL